MTKKSINIITLGCSKNLVDSEQLLQQYKANNINVYHDNYSKYTDIVIINTCGFINDAKQESINTIFDFVNAKKQGKIKELYVMGCLSERYKNDLRKEIPEVDEFFGVYNIKEILQKTNTKYKYDILDERYITTPKHYAYIKISDGCDRTCSFCAIPIIRGKHKSKPIEQIISETKKLAANGTKEIILIAQDLSYYGIDIYKKQALPELVDKLSNIQGIEWIRLHYTYPAGFPMSLMTIMRNNPKVCSYLDIALQHISDNMLLKMRRNITKKQTYKLINDFRKTVPQIKLRTTLLVGHPDETEQDFNELLEFIKTVKFDRLGVFKYSHEENTYAYNNYSDNINDKIKQERYDKIMQIQQQISLSLNKKFIGTDIKVIIDKKEGDFYIARTQFDSPEVDNEVLISAKENNIKIGNFYNVNIFDVNDYDLFGKIIK